MQGVSIQRFGGACAILAGAAALAYSISFILIVPAAPRTGGLFASLFQLLGALFAIVAFVALYERLKAASSGFALLALLLGFAGAIGSATHAGFDLANAINWPGNNLGELPSPADPRGLATFGLAGLAVLLVAWLMRRAGDWPRWLVWIGYLSALLLVLIYLGRLIVVSPKNPALLVPAVLEGFLVGPAWYVVAGLFLRRG